MTTDAAAAQYLAEHLERCKGKRWAVYNPNGISEADLPVIYGFNNGGSYSFMSAVLLAQDGTGLGGHCCSHEGYMPGDLGVLEGARDDRHEDFRKHYPNGYRMEFVGANEVQTHAGLLAAYKLNQEKAEAEDREAEKAQ